MRNFCTLAERRCQPLRVAARGQFRPRRLRAGGARLTSLDPENQSGVPLVPNGRYLFVVGEPRSARRISWNRVQNGYASPGTGGHRRPPQLSTTRAVSSENVPPHTRGWTPVPHSSFPRNEGVPGSSPGVGFSQPSGLVRKEAPSSGPR